MNSLKLFRHVSPKGALLVQCRMASSEAKDLILLSRLNGVTTMTMNDPKKLNGWTMPMLTTLKKTIADLAADSETKVAVLTGADPYYCAGVNLSSILKPMHPRTLRKLIIEHNMDTFDTFISFPKPILVAANGPAIGASVTTATLCDAIIASEKATFSTPFAALGITPEGCSSVHFEKIMGKQNAIRMLDEGWKPTGKEAHEAGFVKEVVQHEKLMERAQLLAESWIKDGKKRSLIEQNLVEEYKKVNKRESEELADAFLSAPFLDAQYKFLKSKGKSGPANFFWALKTSRPFWSKLL